MHRIPALETAPVRQLVNGPESFTPDNRFILGEAPELAELLRRRGLQLGGHRCRPAGAGQALAEWIVGRRAERSICGRSTSVASCRSRATAAILRERAREIVGLHYAMHWPYRQPETARTALLPLHERLARPRRRVRRAAGWERANWFAHRRRRAALRRTPIGRQNWFACAAAEHRAVREAVAVSSTRPRSAKLLLQGSDAAATLQRLCANDVDVPPGRIVYTQMLNRRGGIESDLTVTRLADDAYLIVTIARRRHARRRLDPPRHAGDSRVTLTDVTSSLTVLGVMGPRSRELLARLTGADLSERDVPVRHHARDRARPARCAPPGSPTSASSAGSSTSRPSSRRIVYEDVLDAGADLGLRHAGYHAMDSLRMEKGYRSWGHDIGSDDTPLGGRPHLRRLLQKANFTGRDALLRQRDTPLARRLRDVHPRRPASRSSSATSPSGATACSSAG